MAVFFSVQSSSVSAMLRRDFGVQSSEKPVIPAQAGIHCCAAINLLCLRRIVPTSSFTMDPHLHGDDSFLESDSRFQHLSLRTK